MSTYNVTMQYNIGVGAVDREGAKRRAERNNKGIAVKCDLVPVWEKLTEVYCPEGNKKITLEHSKENNTIRVVIEYGCSGKIVKGEWNLNMLMK